MADLNPDGTPVTPKDGQGLTPTSGMMFDPEALRTLVRDAVGGATGGILQEVRTLQQNIAPIVQAFYAPPVSDTAAEMIPEHEYVSGAQARQVADQQVQPLAQQLEASLKTQQYLAAQIMQMKSDYTFDRFATKYPDLASKKRIVLAIAASEADKPAYQNMSNDEQFEAVARIVRAELAPAANDPQPQHMISSTPSPAVNPMVPPHLAQPNGVTQQSTPVDSEAFLREAMALHPSQRVAAPAAGEKL